MDIKIIESLIDKEWDLFQKTNNIGGRAPCQNDFSLFYMTRASQALAWTEEIVNSCIQDIDEAVAEGRNPMAEKYGYMMKSTSPDEYFYLAFVLPAISEEKDRLATSITTKMVKWADEAGEQFPSITNQGRFIHSKKDSLSETSIETYTYCEMVTYSVKTLKLMDRFCEIKERQNENLWIEVQTWFVKMLGYDSLQDAEDKYRSKV